MSKIKETIDNLTKLYYINHCDVLIKPQIKKITYMNRAFIIYPILLIAIFLSIKPVKSQFTVSQHKSRIDKLILKYILANENVIPDFKRTTLHK